MDWFFYLALVLILGLIVVYSYRYGITPTPTSLKVKKHLFTLLPAINNGEIIELGSGWGTLAFALARRFPTCKVIGYEISPCPYLISRMISAGLNLHNLSFQRKDFFQISLNNASLVVCYLYPGAMQRLKTKFEQELVPGTFIISHTFAVPGWTPIRLEHVDDLYHTPIYLYQMKR